MLIKIQNDLFNIANRVKSIDRDYVIYFNTKNSKYSVYKGRMLQLTLPFDKLDKRTVDYLRKTHVKNINKILAEIELNNKKITESNQNKLKEKINYKTGELAKYLKNGIGNFTNYENI